MPLAALPRSAIDLEQIGFLLGRGYYAYIGLLDRMLAEAGLDQIKPGMGNVLFALMEEDGRTISEVAGRIQLSRSTMTALVERTRAAGLITTRRDPQDGRAVRMYLTPLARSLEDRCRELANDVEARLSADLSDQERRTLRKLLSRVNARINRELELRDDT